MRITKKAMAPAMMAAPAMPPTTPPTMAPVLLLLSLVAGGGALEVVCADALVLVVDELDVEEVVRVAASRTNCGSSSMVRIMGAV